MKITPIDFSPTDSSPKRFSQQRVRRTKVPRTDNSPNRHFPSGQFPEWHFPERAVPRRTFPQTYISFQENKGDWYELLVLNKWSLRLCYYNWKYHEKKRKYTFSISGTELLVLLDKFEHLQYFLRSAYFRELKNKHIYMILYIIVVVVKLIFIYSW